MTTQELAEQVRNRGRYKKRDDTSEMSAFQVHHRPRPYPNLFYAAVAAFCVPSEVKRIPDPARDV